ncbi:hypothetical protein E8E15_002283 [Penicillium rubens]|uniref:Uncharacterized protein n=1 Tax=Penicillium chrysogenum TaxID=5076 RepID=A0A167PSK7_PENCH|nr:hypothetical protein E8E15_002283 [Penicillium rubens]KZN83754.1 hypothetical protein EN45_108600 [Penicillium chrysogenum]
MTFAFGYAVINSSAKHAAGTSHTAFKAHVPEQLIPVLPDERCSHAVKLSPHCP